MALGKFLWLSGRFARDRGGNFIVMAGVVLAVLAMAVGFAVDIGQMMNARSALSNAIDAAVTSTARDLTSGTATEEEAAKAIKAYLSANSTGGILSYDKIVLSKVTLDRTSHTLEVSAYVDVPLFFPLFSSEKTRRVSQTGAAVYSFRQIEVAMMLDLTGSMNEGNKIGSLQTAATNAITTIFRNQDPSRPRVRVALVPYANSVKVGSSLATNSVYVETSVAERSKPAPSNTTQRPPSSSINPGSCATERKGDYQYSDVGPDVAMVKRDYLLSQFIKKGNRGEGTLACPDAELMPLTSDAAALKARIGSFVASGGTAGHIGVQWTWYILSPSWAGVLGESQRPMAFDPAKVAKYAILMTDGEFNLSYFDASDVSQVYNDRGKVATRDSAKRLCLEMRKQGIEIFTIGFDLDEDNARETLQNCASPDAGGIKHFYDVATGTELDKAFQAIANNLQKLALTK
ncbi:pilus assembly protein [Mesorhizobium retamae]|uniref:Pilus assembly protein TadG-related protein n=1 Tax=Mesorhizobium retamae TaxID=2912854 RepID=A0ABS9QA15_9HYPH|nr:pilus assembly protein [Mesorhizobium sp. IRAMC:0171]MCG7504240.1 pilus assembly protein TadG-related protein [Mesorhizobium sp. IRAMC:0171]